LQRLPPEHRPTDSTNGAVHSLTAVCLHCGSDFVPRKRGHVFCSVGCRHGGARQPEERAKDDPEQVARLFDPSRDPKERVCRDDRYQDPAHGRFELDLPGTVVQRRRWYLAVRELGLL